MYGFPVSIPTTATLLPSRSVECLSRMPCVNLVLVIQQLARPCPVCSDAVLASGFLGYFSESRAVSFMPFKERWQVGSFLHDHCTYPRDLNLAKDMSLI